MGGGIPPLFVYSWQGTRPASGKRGAKMERGSRKNFCCLSRQASFRSFRLPNEHFSTTNNNTSGSLTKGKTAEIKGSYIKIAGEHTDCGIYFTNMDTKAKTKVPAENIALNEPSRLLILVPDSLPAGNYELSITTQSSSGKPLLKQPRTEVFNGTVVIS